MMEVFTSLDPEQEITTEIPEQWEQVEVLEDLQEENLFLSDQEQVQENSQNGNDQSSLLKETREIKDLLKGYLDESNTESLVEASSEETTDYIKLIYGEVKRQNDNIGSLEGKVITMARDQQIIGILSVGSSILLIGALGVFFFLWRVR